MAALGAREGNAALRQLADWARAWVQNETCIEETPAEKLSDAEKGALMLIYFFLESR